MSWNTRQKMCLMGKSYSSNCSWFHIEVCQNSSLQDNISMATWQNGTFLISFKLVICVGEASLITSKSQGFKSLKLYMF